MSPVNPVVLRLCQQPILSISLNIIKIIHVGTQSETQNGSHVKLESSKMRTSAIPCNNYRYIHVFVKIIDYII